MVAGDLPDGAIARIYKVKATIADVRCQNAIIPHERERSSRSHTTPRDIAPRALDYCAIRALNGSLQAFEQLVFAQGGQLIAAALATCEAGLH
jgi:hypothetical protein